MEAEERDTAGDRATNLRQELKSWEKQFTAGHGRKAGREDIKKNEDIAQKYKEYNSLSGRTVERDSKALNGLEPTLPRKRRRDAGDSQALSASKRLLVMRTPSRNQSLPSIHPANVDPYDSPTLVKKLFTPSRPRVIGPTPQKDGLALGLFDLLPSGDDYTPEKDEQNVSGIHATPSKSRETLLEDIYSTRHSRTPASAGKRFMLDNFATPLKRRHPNEQGGNTPSSVSKLQFTTPSFLRRDSQRLTLASIDETEDGLTLSPEMVRRPQRPLVRGLSSMLASLRKMEEDAADEDLEALHEMEAGETAPRKPASKETTLVEDSQPPFLLGGFDDPAMYDSEPDESTEPQLGRDGLPLKVWKKKGQKRTTRRVTMKPARTMPLPKASLEDRPDEDEMAAMDELVEETQLPETSLFEDVRNFDSDSGSEYTASEGGTRYKRPDQSKKKKRIGPDGKIVTAARKVGAMAHANFKRLKLRNSGAKGGPANDSRFKRKK